MKKKTQWILISSSVLVTATLLGSQTATPQSASPSAAVSASSSASAPKEEALPEILRGKDVPSTASEFPKLEEWKDGRAISANSGRAPCSFKVLREYLQITCKYFVATGLFAGSPKDVTVFASGDSVQNETWTPPLSVIVMPIRRGEARMVNLLNLSGGGYGPAWAGSDAWISVAFRDGDDDPIILMKAPTELITTQITSI
jgi:hypothetical protein